MRRLLSILCLALTARAFLISHRHHGGRRRPSSGSPREKMGLWLVSSIRVQESKRISLLKVSSSVSMMETILELDPEQVLPSHTVDTIQQLVDLRGTARWEGNYPLADKLKEEILAVSLPEGLVLSLEDVPRAKGGGSRWKLQYQVARNTTTGTNTTREEIEPSILQLAHAALGIAISCSQTMTSFEEKQQQLDPLVHQAKATLQSWKSTQDQIELGITPNDHPHPLSGNGLNSLPFHGTNPQDSGDSAFHGWSLVETTLRGRKAADAAFWLALAGVADDELYELLAHVAIKELLRFGSKPTCRAKDIYQMMDRFAAAGLRTATSATATKLEAVARECLQSKQPPEKHQQNSVEEQSSSLLDLHSDRCLLLQWKFSAGQKKQQFFLQSARKHFDGTSDVDGMDHLTSETSDQVPLRAFERRRRHSIVSSWHDRFADPTLPLVIDVGCGMGLSLLGLASVGQTSETVEHTILESRGLLGDVSCEDCNFLGVDLSGLTVGYARGISQRWGVCDRLHWEVYTAEDLLQVAHDSYPGPICLCLIQFPTPYRLPTTGTDNNEGNGNSQLPTSALDGFMVSPGLLKLIHKVLSKSHGHLILQSNCEDVALWMHDTAIQQCGFEAMKVPHPVKEAALDDLPQRTQNWIAMGGDRAVESTWSAVPLLPRIGSTETEVACRLNRTPIHRCVLVPRTT